MNELDGLIEAASSKAAAKAAPAGWEPGVDWRGDAGTITTPPLTKQPNDWDELLKVWDLDPQKFEVVEPVQYRAWDGPVAGGGVHRMFYYRATVRRRGRGADIQELISSIGRKKPRERIQPPEHLPWFVTPTADTQLGDGDTSRTVEFFKEKTLLAVDRYKVLVRRKQCAEEVVLPWLGDCIQGTITSAPIAKNDLSPVEMLRLARRLIIWQLEQWWNIAHVWMPVIPGNHDEPLRASKGPMYDADQSWAIEAVVGVQDACIMAGRTDVQFVYPRKGESTICMDIAGTLVGFAHGHQWSGAAAGLHTWWAKQSHGRTPVGGAQLLLCGHRHHFYAEVAGDNRMGIICPPMVETAQYWTDARGDRTDPGLVTMLVGQGGWHGLEML